MVHALGSKTGFVRSDMESKTDQNTPVIYNMTGLWYCARNSESSFTPSKETQHTRITYLHNRKRHCLYYFISASHTC